MITETQLAHRSKGIGSSDAASLLGLNPWKPASECVLEKRGLIPPFAGNDATEMGNIAEPFICALAEAEIGHKLVKPTGTYVRGILRANPDRQVGAAARGQAPVEAKLSGLTDGWGDPGTDQIPASALVQVIVQMLCIEADEGHVARLHPAFGRLNFSLYRVQMVGVVCDLAAKIETECCDIWQRFVVNGDPMPEDWMPPTGDALGRVLREAGKVVEVDPELVADWRARNAARITAEKMEDEAKSRLIAAMGDAEYGSAGGGGVVSYTRNKPSRKFDAKRFQTENPKVAEGFMFDAPGALCLRWKQNTKGE